TFSYTNSDELASATKPASVGAETTFYVYDNRGRRTTVTAPDGLSVVTSYGTANDILSVSGARTYPVAYEYTPQGRLRSMTTSRNGVPVKTTLSYDPASGLLLSKQYADNLGPSYTWSPGGRLATRTWARGSITTYTPNAAGDIGGISYNDLTPPVALT